MGFINQTNHLPPPFKRKSIDLDRIKREWQTLPAEALRTGDLLPNFGLIAERDNFYGSYDTARGLAKPGESIPDAEPDGSYRFVHVRSVSGVQRIYFQTEELLMFTELKAEGA